MSVNMNDLPELPISQYPVGSWYLQTDEDGCKVPWIRLCVGTDADWCSLQSLITLENDPTKGCCDTLECGVLNLPNSFIWKRTSEDEEFTQYIPRSTMTPIAISRVMADTPEGGGHGDGLCIPCDGLWNIESTVTILHPLEEGVEDPPWSEDAIFGLFVGNGQGQSNPSFLRQHTNSWTVDGLYRTQIYVQREIPIRGGACYYNNLFWEDVSSDELDAVVIESSTIKATHRRCMPDAYDGPWAM